MTPTIREAFIAALTRRAQEQQGATRELLEARLTQLRAESEACGSKYLPPLGQADERGPLGRLADGFAARHASMDSTAPEVPGLSAGSAAQRELGTLRQFRGAWSRMFAEQRLRQTMEQVPPQAGPLNSHHLVHRALAVMQEISPAYLQRFVTQVEALLWLEQQQLPVVATPQKLEKRKRK